MEGMFEWQHSLLRQGQRTMEQALDVQQNVAESMWRNNLGTGRNLQQQSTEFARNWTDAFFGAMGTMMDEAETDRMRETLHEQYQELDEAQRETWQAFEESMNESMDAYDELTRSQKEVLDRAVNSWMDAQASVGEEFAHAAEEMGRQARDVSQETRQESE